MFPNSPIMSVNITVNGTFGKHCAKPFAVKVTDRNELLERRKQRIVQVRQESKEIARKLREEVSKEKQRQLLKFNELKAKEFQMWQSQAAARMKHDYRACFSHVGSAHYAAKIENEQRAAKNKRSSTTACSNIQGAAGKMPRLPPFSQVGAAYYISGLENEENTAAPRSCFSPFRSDTDRKLKKHTNGQEQPCPVKPLDTYAANQNSKQCAPKATVPPKELCSNIENQSNVKKDDQCDVPQPTCCRPQMGVMYYPRNPLSYPQVGSSYFSGNRQCEQFAAVYNPEHPPLSCINVENPLHAENISLQQTCSTRIPETWFAGNPKNKKCAKQAKEQPSRIRPNQDNKPAKIKTALQATRVPPRGVRTVPKNKQRPSSETKRHPLKTSLNKENQKIDVSPRRPSTKALPQAACTQTNVGKKPVSPKRAITCQTTKIIQDPKCDCCNCNNSSTESSFDTLVESCEISSTDSKSDKLSEEEEDAVTIIPPYQERTGQPKEVVAVGVEKEVECNDVGEVSGIRRMKKGKTNQLRKTPAVMLDLDIGCNDIMTVTTPNEVRDHFAENNRQFSSIIRISPPEKARKATDTSNHQVPVSTSEPLPDSQVLKPTEIDSTSGPLIKSPTTTKNLKPAKTPSDVPTIQQRQKTTESVSDTSQLKSRNLPPLSTKTSNEQSTKHTDKPRFTQISDLIQKSNTNLFQYNRDTLTIHSDKTQKQTSSEGVRIGEDDNTPPMRAGSAHPPTSAPKKRTYKTTELLSKCKDSPVVVQSKKNTAQKMHAESTTSNAGHSVQFYDYSNKFGKTYQQPEEAVSIQLQDQTQPTAMEQARVEEKRKDARLQRAGDLRKKSEDRGKKAIEREQVRRDCNELTQKLDALSKQHPRLLPVDPNTDSHLRICDAATQKEIKMNAAVEEMLMRPAIITCPQITQETATSDGGACKGRAETHRPIHGSINLGAPATTTLNIDSSATSTDSCRSLLLGYVNDQSKQIKNDLSYLEANPLNQDKSLRLQALLERIEQLRTALLTELQSSSSAVHCNVENVEKVIDSISAVRKERESIVLDNITDQTLLPFQQREKELQQKEAILERRIKEFYNSQTSDAIKQPVSPSAPTEDKRRICTDTDKPLEIIIKVRNTAVKEVTKVNKPKYLQRKSPCKVAIKLHSPIAKRNKKTTAMKKQTPLISKNLQNNSNSKILPSAGQNSYDSNSTSYRSLPPAIGNSGTVEGPASAPQNIKQSTSQNEHQNVPRLNPLIAHYVQRLLGMSRNSILALGVSSSEIVTPSESVLNTTANRSGSENDLVSSERMERVQKFIEDNHSLITQLEESQQGSNNSNISFESTIRAFEEIWKQKLCQQEKHERRPQSIADPLKNLRKKKSGTEGKQKNIPQEKASKVAERNSQCLQGEQKNSPKPQIKEKYKGAPNESQNEMARKQNSVRNKVSMRSKRGAKRTTDQSSETDSTHTQRDFARYAQLTDSCTQRIAELTELISKVREEKQKILENTLSSVSENGCSSTEYMELPSTTDRLRPNSMPLEKYKHTGMSRDSGISESRPLTSQEHLHDLMEPVSMASSTNTPSVRKPKPPPSLVRFSPQLIEDELVHELSTIPEVETPIASRLNISITSSSTAVASTQRVQFGSMFPTFEQYVKQTDVDLTPTDPEQPTRLHQEFESLLMALSDARGNIDLNCNEFPSLNTYLKKISAQLVQENGHITLSDTAPETIENLLACLRLSNPNISAFPNSSEYIRRIRNNTPEGELIDSVSLENVTDFIGQSTESESINIEDELRRRNILKSSFRRMSPNKKEEFFNSTLKQQDVQNKELCRSGSAAESGIEKISSPSTHSGELERDLLGVGIRWPTTMREKCKEAQALRSSSSTATSKCLNANESRSENDKGQPKISSSAHSKQGKSGDESLKCGRSLNLRDFLTKELLKHSNQLSTSTSTSEESLKSQFLQSIIGSLTPSGTARTTAPASKQKTSTPLGSNSTQSTSSSIPISSQLFSVESRLSSVRYEYSSPQSKESKRDAECEGD